MHVTLTSNVCITLLCEALRESKKRKKLFIRKKKRPLSTVYLNEKQHGQEALGRRTDNKDLIIPESNVHEVSSIAQCWQTLKEP